MSTPSDGAGSQWQQPGGPSPSPSSAPSGYGQPSSPSYGKYGQGQALPVPSAPVPPGPGQPPGQPGWGQPAWGEPGYSAPQQRPPWSGPATLQPAGGGLSTAVIWLSLLTGAGVVTTAYLAPNQHKIIVDALNGVQASTTQVGSGAYRAVSALSLLAEVAVWVVTSLWLTQVRQNALVLRPGGQRRSESWVWLGWVIPIVNFWFPLQIIRDTVAATAEAGGERPIRTGPWWAAWLLMMVSGIAAGLGTLLPPNDVTHRILTGVEALLVILAVTLWIRIVRYISVKQDALARSRS